MGECEICGNRSANTRIRIDSSVLNVCKVCASTGTIIDIPKPTPSAVPVTAENIRPGAEEIVVEDFGKLIAKARQKTGLKQDEIALKLNEKLQVIHAAESGRRLEIKLAKKLEKFFGIKLIEVL